MPRGSPRGAYIVAAPRQCGFVDFDGRVIVEAKYRSVTHFSEGCALVRVGKYAGFVACQVPEAISCRYRTEAQNARAGSQLFANNTATDPS
jgi:hypothetical protein